jgi:hypothetical protein
MTNQRIFLRKAATGAGEFGAAIYPINVDVSGITGKALDSAAIKNSIVYFLNQNGWKVSSLSVSKSTQTANLYFLSVVISAAKNTYEELERVKQGVGNVLNTVFPISGIAASYGGRAAQTVTQNKIGVSSFSFQIVSIGSAPLKDRHAKFNQLFTTAFPKILYTVPSTSYNDAGLASISYFGGSSQIAATGETTLTPDQTKTKIKDLLRLAGVDAYQIGTINFDQKTIAQLESGSQLTPATMPADKGAASNNSNGISSFFPALPNGNFFDTLAASLGVSTPIALVAGALIFVLIMRR